MIFTQLDGEIYYTFKGDELKIECLEKYSFNKSTHSHRHLSQSVIKDLLDNVGVVITEVSGLFSHK